MFKAIAAGAFSWRGVAIVIVAWTIIAGVMSGVAPSIEEVSTNDESEFLHNGTESLEAIKLEGEKFSASDGAPAIIIYRNPSGITDKDIAKVSELDAIIRADEEHENIKLVISDFGEQQFGDDPQAQGPPSREDAGGPELSPDGTCAKLLSVGGCDGVRARRCSNLLDPGAVRVVSGGFRRVFLRSDARKGARVRCGPKPAPGRPTASRPSRCCRPCF